MKQCISFLFFSLFAFTGTAQEMWGISNSNFSGNMGIFLNPSTIVAAPYKYEFNLVAADVFAENTYVYIPKDKKIITRGLTGSVQGEIKFIDIYDDKLKSGFGHVLVIGPSLIYNEGSYAWGIHTAFRSELCATNIPSALAKFIYARYKYEPFINENFNPAPFSAAGISWGELGGTYGRVLIDKHNDYLKAAGTLNLLAGFDGIYLDVRQLDYSVYDSSTAIVHRMDATIGHALNENGNSGTGNFLALRGYGVSTTLGATYIHNRNRAGYDCNKTADDRKKYQYRLGVSLMDFGMIHFGSQARVMEIKTSTDRTWSQIDTVTFHSLGHLDQLLSNNINGTVSSVENKSFNMYLPTAISVQFDYSFTPHLYGNATLVNRVHYSTKEVARGNQLDLSVRYEKRKWEVTGDFTLFEYNQPSAGIGFRYFIFVLGSDRLLELLSLRDVKSFDFFFGLKLNFCDLHGKNKVSCPAFGR